MKKRRKRQILYPEEDPTFVRCLKFPCGYCQDKFFKVYPVRAKGLEPLHGLYMIRTKHSKKLVGICNNCILEFSRRNESEFSNNLEGWGRIE